MILSRSNTQAAAVTVSILVLCLLVAQQCDAGTKTFSASLSGNSQTTSVSGNIVHRRTQSSADFYNYLKTRVGSSQLLFSWGTTTNGIVFGAVVTAAGTTSISLSCQTGSLCSSWAPLVEDEAAEVHTYSASWSRSTSAGVDGAVWGPMHLANSGCSVVTMSINSNNKPLYIGRSTATETTTNTLSKVTVSTSVGQTPTVTWTICDSEIQDGTKNYFATVNGNSFTQYISGNIVHRSSVSASSFYTLLNNQVGSSNLLITFGTTHIGKYGICGFQTHGYAYFI
jgi:hypothetical protein